MADGFCFPRGSVRACEQLPTTQPRTHTHIAPQGTEGGMGNMDDDGSGEAVWVEMHDRGQLHRSPPLRPRSASASAAVAASGQSHPGLGGAARDSNGVSFDGSGSFHSARDGRSDDDDDDDDEDDDGFEGDLDRDSRSVQRRRSSVASFQLYTPEEEKAVVRKFDRRLVAFLSLCYMLSFLDRSSKSTYHLCLALQGNTAVGEMY